jgi:hypothetical protein
LPHKTITEYVHSMSATMESANLAAASLDWTRIGGLWSAAERERDLLARFTDRLSLRHADLIASLETSDGLLASAPPFVSELPTLGVFVHTGAVRSITPHEPLEADEEDLFHLAASPFHDLETATLLGMRCGYVNRSGHPLLPEAKPLFTVRDMAAAAARMVSYAPAARVPGAERPASGRRSPRPQAGRRPGSRPRR